MKWRNDLPSRDSLDLVTAALLLITGIYVTLRYFGAF